MTRKNEIDELFRSALGDKGMNFTPEYWEQMEALIASKRMKAIKRAIWFGTGFTLLIVLTLLFSPPQNEGSEERTFGQSGGAEGAESGERTFGRSGGAEGAESLVARQGDDGISDITETPDRVEGSGLQGRHPEQANDISDLAETPRRVEGSQITNHKSKIINQKSELTTIPSLQPESLGNSLQITQAKSTPLSVENPKNLLRRPPSYTQLYLESFVNYGWVKHRYEPSIHTWKTANEKPQPFMHYGLNIRASKRGFSLRIGAGIRQWTEHTNYTREIDHYTFDTTLRLVKREFIQRPDGSYAALVRKQIDTTSHTTTIEFICPDCPVSFRYLTLPVAIHYEYGWGKWLGFTEAAMTFSFLSKATGEYGVQWQNETGKSPGMQTDKLSGKYLSPMVMQAGLTLGIKYRIHPFLSIKGQMAYERSLNSMMTMYRQETDFYGFGLGIEWKLF